MALPNASSLPEYGGAMQDYGGIGVVDPTTDQGAAQHNQSMADLAAMTNTTVRAWCIFTAAASPVLSSHGALWGNSSAVQPTISRTGAGAYTVTWPSTITDGLGVSRAVTSSAAWSVPVNISTASFAFATRTGANTATVSALNLAGAAADTNAYVFVALV